MLQILEGWKYYKQTVESVIYQTVIVLLRIEAGDFNFLFRDRSHNSQLTIKVYKPMSNPCFYDTNLVDIFAATRISFN